MKREYGYHLIQEGRYGHQSIDLLFDGLSKSFEEARKRYPHFDQCEYGYFDNNNVSKEWHSVNSDEN